MTCSTKRGVSELKLSKAQSPNISLKDNSNELSQISIKHGKDGYFTADGKNVSQAIKEIIEKERIEWEKERQ